MPENKGQTDLPKIYVNADGQVTAGAFLLEPSHRHFRKRRAYWRACLDGRVVTPWWPTPRLALLAALRQTTAP